MKFIPYNKNLKEFSQMLRKNSTLGEVLLWMQIQKRQIRGHQFNRQKPLGNYIVDFYCKALNLVIEIDGGSHKFDEVMVNDVKRQKILEELGVNFLRFTEQEVLQNMDRVIWTIEGYVDNYENENE